MRPLSRHLRFRCVLLALVFTVAWFDFPGSLASAQLVWERTIHETHAKNGDKEARASFAFENKGSYPVVIRKVRPSCGCTKAELKQDVYKPGERGEITAIFKFENRKGQQEKSILVETDDSKHPREVLLMRVDIPDVIKTNKQQLTWEVGGLLEAQFVEIAVEAGQAVKVNETSNIDGLTLDW